MHNSGRCRCETRNERKSFYPLIPVIQTNHTRNMVGCASGSKTHTNIQSKEALFLTKKKLIISTQRNSCFLSAITRGLFPLTSLAARRFSCLFKSLFIFGAGCKLVRLVLGYNLPAVPTFTSDFYQFLSPSNTLQ